MLDTEQLVEIRWHGRGGQGAVTSAELLAQAAISEGKYAQAFPSFGPERRGAPVLAFVRIDKNHSIRMRDQVVRPDVVVVLDSGLLRIVNVAAGLKEDGIAVFNTTKPAGQVRQESGIRSAIATVDATRIARQLLGVPITNTTMIGALIRATEVVGLDSLVEPIKRRFGRLAERNIEAMKRAYEETSVEELAIDFKIRK